VSLLVTIIFDHAKGVDKASLAGKDIYMLKETRTALNLSGHRYHDIEFGKQFRAGSFNVVSFPLEHDVPNAGFLFEGGGEKAVYITDTSFVRNRFVGLDHIIIECNYDEHTLTTNMHNGSLEKFRADRVIETHFGLSNVVEFLEATDLSKVKSIHLIHLSDGNANEQLIRETVENAIGKLVIIP